MLARQDWIYDWRREPRHGKCCAAGARYTALPDFDGERTPLKPEGGTDADGAAGASRASARLDAPAFVASPRLLGEFRLGAGGDIIVAVGKPPPPPTGDAGLGLGHQALQFGGRARASACAPARAACNHRDRIGGIDERRRHTVPHLRAAGNGDGTAQAAPARRRARQSCTAESDGTGHRTLVRENVEIA